jgi:hypothetical protein
MKAAVARDQVKLAGATELGITTTYLVPLFCFVVPDPDGLGKAVLA